MTAMAVMAKLSLQIETKQVTNLLHLSERQIHQKWINLHRLHRLMPPAQMRQRLRQPVMAGIEEVFHHAEEIEIGEQRAMCE